MVFPLYDNNPFAFKSPPYVNWALIAANVAIFLYMLSVAGALAYWASTLAANVPLVGASGAVAGVVGAYLLLHPCRKIWVLAFMRIPIKLAAEWVIGFWIGLQFLNIFAGADKGVAWWTHIGGLMAGARLCV